MAMRSIKGNQELAKKIKARRNELGLTIEEAAIRAGVGIKTWSRYEAGESIREDKYKGVCKALNWYSFIENEDDEIKEQSILDKYLNHEAWSEFLAKTYGRKAALSFAVGSEILLDMITDDLSDLSTEPVGTHIGELDTSYIADELPPQFLMRYDYEFLYRMRCTLIQLRMGAGYGNMLIAHSVMEELIIYLADNEGKEFMEACCGDELWAQEDDYDEGWVFSLFEDMDLITMLYSDRYVEEDSMYHFRRWSEPQFFLDY